MSGDDLQRVKEVARLNAREVAARAADDRAYAERINALFHPAVEFHSRLTGVEGRAYRGHEGLDRYRADMLEAFDDWGPEGVAAERLADGRVLVTGGFRVRGRESGAPALMQHASVWELEDGLVRRVETFGSEQQARASTS